MSIVPRTSYLGGSDAAAILGTHQYRSRLAVWQAKRGLVPDLDLSNNPHVLRGEVVEPIVEAYIRTHIDDGFNDQESWDVHDAGPAERRLPVRNPYEQIMLMDKELHPATGLPYIGGHPDGISVKTGILYEIKAPTSYKLERIINGGLPSEWVMQVQHYLMIAKLREARMVIWDCDAWQPHIMPIYADFDLHEIMRQTYREFWQHVVDGTEPVDGTDAIAHQVTVLDDEYIERLLREYRIQYNRRYHSEDRQKLIRMQIVTAAQGKRTLITPKYTAKIDPVTMYGKPTVRLTVTENQALL